MMAKTEKKKVACITTAAVVTLIAILVVKGVLLVV